MKIAILSILEDTNSVVLFSKEANRRGHKVDVINYLECTLQLNKAGQNILYGDRKLERYDIVIPLIASGYSGFGASVLKSFEDCGSYCLNSSEGVLLSKDKFKSLQILKTQRIPIPTSSFSYSKINQKKQYESFEVKTVVAKKNEGTQGSGVYKIDSFEDFEKSLGSSNSPVFMQEYISEAQGADIRILVLGEKVIAQMLRQAAPGEFRSNIHLGGKAKEIEITEEERNMAIKATQLLHLKLAGVDIIRSKSGPMILEVNSAPGFKGFAQIGQTQLESEIFDFIEKDLVKIRV